MPGERTAYCGVECSECADYTGGKCPGCRQTDWQAGDTCLPVECCREKQISLCGECASFPCEEMKAFYQESESHERAYRRLLSMRTSVKGKRTGTAGASPEEQKGNAGEGLI